MLNLDAGMRSYVQELIAQRQAVFDYADAKITGKRAGVSRSRCPRREPTRSARDRGDTERLENKPADSASKPFKHRVTGVTRACASGVTNAAVIGKLNLPRSSWALRLTTTCSSWSPAAAEATS